MFARHLVRFAESRALLRTGRRIAIRMAMMPMTTNSSTRVKAPRRVGAVCLPVTGSLWVGSLWVGSLWVTCMRSLRVRVRDDRESFSIVGVDGSLLQPIEFFPQLPKDRGKFRGGSEG